MISTFIQLCFMDQIFIVCTAPHNNGAIPIRRSMREQHESDSEDEEEASDDEDDHPGDADESISADVGL